MNSPLITARGGSRSTGRSNRRKGGMSAAIGAALILLGLAAERPVALFSHGAVGRVLRGLYMTLPGEHIVELDEPQDAFYRLHRGAAERIGALIEA